MTDAQLLQCPDCSHRHDLSALGAVETFLCAGCGRPLKVPAVLRSLASPLAPGVAAPNAAAPPTIAPAMPPASRVAASAAATSAMPAVNPGRRGDAARVSTGPVRIHLWIRLLIWLVAVPVGMFVVFGIASKIGVITFDELLKTFTASGWDRFAPIAKILPIAALLIAIMVQAAVTGLERREKKIRMALSTTAANAGPDRLEARNVG